MNEKSLENLNKRTPFQPGQSGNLAGRKPDRIKRFIKEYDVSKADVDYILKTLIWECSPDDLAKLIMPKSKGGKGTKNLAAGIAAFASGIVHDIKRGDAKVTSMVLDRIYGKPNLTIGAEINSVITDVSNMPVEERKKMIAELMNKANV